MKFKIEDGEYRAICKVLDNKLKEIYVDKCECQYGTIADLPDSSCLLEIVLDNLGVEY